MSAFLACKRVGLRGLREFGASKLTSSLDRSNSDGKRSCLLDTLSLVKRLEESGMPSNQARAIIEVSKKTLENAFYSSISQGEGRSVLASVSQREMEAALKSVVEKFISEVKVKSSLELLNEIKHEMNNLRSEMNNTHNEVNNNISKVVDKVEAQLSTVKYEVLKYGIGAIVSFSVAGVVVGRFLLGH